ncbi:HDOD domain-containing protein [Thalassotalea marina]|uniref:HDOD domain-containing protein n=1 Tax=Thalassotalea marina TaxID=1673741 RepID=A0A919BTC7_9GAMM|nr:HDOD domain-containing protein [Thalassotalea marina]GHG08429.1 hypothetical protein GCM10017161_42760 [Thalassotalea marina]
MFKRLIESIFKKKHQATYDYFERTKASDNKPEELSAPKVLVDKSINHEPFFVRAEYHYYDYCFGIDDEANNDELARRVMEDISLLMKTPEKIIESLPQLPMSVTQILSSLDNDDFQLDSLLDIIHREPVIAARVIKVANTSYYNKSGKDVLDLKQAFMLLGKQGVLQGVLLGFFQNMVPQPNAYFQRYGRLIWEHAEHTASLARSFFPSKQQKSDASHAYLLGLLCNLGEMVIYQLLIESFAFIAPDATPSNIAFKKLMSTKSKPLTYHMAKYWKFPKPIIDGLAIQAKLDQMPLSENIVKSWPIASAVYEANFISRYQQRIDAKHIRSEQANIELMRLVKSEQAQHLLSEQLTDKV